MDESIASAAVRFTFVVWWNTNKGAPAADILGLKIQMMGLFGSAAY